MIPAANVRSVKTRGVMSGAEFGISLADSAHIMTILRDTLYSDKVMAVLREYSANAWDSHRMSGKGDLPIKVHLPTATEPVLQIRDFGSGLSRDDVFNVYTQYGASTKRDSDTAVGMLGIGSKSGFAYSDTFTVTSWFGGTKSVYAAMLDPSDKGEIKLIGEEPCGDETGIMIEIPVKTADVHEFRDKAQRLYVHFDPRPDINITLEIQGEVLGKYESGTLFKGESYSSSITAVMGCVPYRVDLDQVRSFEEGLPQFMFNVTALINFEIGEVHINASREELKYSEKTKRAIIDKLNKLIDDYVQDMLRALKDPSVSPWQRRLRSQALRTFGSFVPVDFKDYTEWTVKLEKDIPQVKIGDTVLPDGTKKDILEPLFWLSTDKRQRTGYLNVSSRSRIVLKDDNRTMKGFQFTGDDVIVHRGRTRPDHAVIAKAVSKLLDTVGATGVPVVKTSTLPWTHPHGPLKRDPNAKHGHKFFRFEHGNADSGYTRRGRRRKEGLNSSCWEIVVRNPSKDDVYVEIEHFRTDFDLLEMHRSDRALGAKFGMTLPDVWGYKVTKRDPSKARLGTEYREWRKKFAAEILTKPEFLAELEKYDWYNLTSNTGYYSSNIPDHKAVAAELGSDHLVTKLFEDAGAALKNRHSYGYNRFEHVTKVQRLLGEFDPKVLPATRRLNEITEKYPLFTCDGVLLVRIGVNSDNLKKWCNYIKMVDQTGEK